MNARFPHLPAESWERFLSDELAPEAAERLEAHLRECAQCRQALESADASFLFRRLRDEAAPEAAFDGLWEAIDGEIRRAPPRRAAPATRLAFLGGAAAAAAILAVAFLGLGRAPWGPEPQLTAAQPVAPPVPTAAEPCPAVVAASLKLTREECAALYGGPISSAEPPEVLVSDSLDLRGL